MSVRAVAAVDLGATSGRVMIGRIGEGRLELELVSRFPNGPVERDDGLHWDFSALYEHVVAGLAEAVRREPAIESIGIDSWAVDYGLLAVELGEYGIRVNGINPDGVVRGSGIFASGWGANRAATYGVAEEDLGQYYANRTILKREVVPENVADAVYVLTGPELSRTTGLHIPVDSGVAAAFLR